MSTKQNAQCWAICILESYIKSSPRRYTIECMKNYEITNHIPCLLYLEVVLSGVKRSLVAGVVEWGLANNLNGTLIRDDILL